MGKTCCTYEPSTVGSADPFDIVSLKSLDGFLQLPRSTEHQMGTPKDCVYFLLLRLLPRMLDNIDHPGMGAAEKHYESFWRLQK